MSASSSRRRGGTITLAVTSADQDDVSDDGVHEQVLPPVVAGLLGGLVAAAAGWVLMAGLMVGGWLTAPAGSLADALYVGTQGWLAGHGAGFVVGGTRWTVIPLTLTVVFGLLIHTVASFTAKQRLAGRVDIDDRDRFAAVRRATWLVSASYVAAVVLVGLVVGGVEQAARGLLGAAVLALVSSWLGATRGARVHWINRIPTPWPTVLRATATAIGVILLAGLVTLVLAIILHFDRVQSLSDALEAGPVGNVLLWTLQAAFLPNAVVWSATWLFGSGFTLGVDTIVSPAHTDLGLIPAVPVFGALPAEGPGAISPWWWLFGAAIGGVVAAARIVRARPHARFDETSLFGGLAGVLAALGFVAIAAITGGDLGTEYLVAVGPRLLELLVMALGVLGISGLLGGLVIGLWRWWRLRRARRAADQPENRNSPGDNDDADHDDA